MPAGDTPVGIFHRRAGLPGVTLEPLAACGVCGTVGFATMSGKVALGSPGAVWVGSAEGFAEVCAPPEP